MPKLSRSIVVFLLAQVPLLFWIYGSGLWGGSMLAPLDIAPAMFSKYRYLVTESNVVPANHYIVDQLTYDLPLQKSIYESYHQGAVPWWDPYNYGGRPLLADAHINGTDPVRLLCYAALPFDHAYNWTRILHGILAGLALFLLLRRLGIDTGIAVWISVAYEYGGHFTLWFGHPWIQASQIYYPLLWWLMDVAWENPRPRHYIIGSLLVAANFYSGNLQSHAYLPFFAVGLAWGYAVWSPAKWGRQLAFWVPIGLLGGCLALPVIAGQIEFYLLGRRVPQIADASGARGFLGAPLSLTAVFPWLLGTYRTLDASKLAGATGLGFHLYCGSVVVVLAVLGWWLTRSATGRPPWVRGAMVQVAFYFFFLATPLIKLLYTRVSCLATLGLAVLAAAGVKAVRESNRDFRRLAWMVGGGALLLFIGANVGALVVYPRVEERIARWMNSNAQMSFLPSLGALRDFQVRNFAAEVSFRNPETVMATVSLVALAVLLTRPGCRQKQLPWHIVLALNLIPVMLFAHRFIPRHPTELWHALLKGGPEQQRVVEQAGPGLQRVMDSRLEYPEMVFPHSLQHLYRIHTVHGYSSILPASLAILPPAEQDAVPAQFADWFYDTPEYGMPRGNFRGSGLAHQVRFQWQGAAGPAPQVSEPDLNTIVVTFPTPASGRLLWTDTRYPGWRAVVDDRPVTLEPVAPTFSAMQLSGASRLVLHYQPRYLRVGGIAAAAAVVILLGIGLLGRRKAAA